MIFSSLMVSKDIRIIGGKLIISGGNQRMTGMKRGGVGTQATKGRKGGQPQRAKERRKRETMGRPHHHHGPGIRHQSGNLLRPNQSNGRTMRGGREAEVLNGNQRVPRRTTRERTTGRKMRGVVRRGRTILI